MRKQYAVRPERAGQYIGREKVANKMPENIPEGAEYWDDPNFLKVGVIKGRVKILRFDPEFNEWMISSRSVEDLQGCRAKRRIRKL